MSDLRNSTSDIEAAQRSNIHDVTQMAAMLADGQIPLVLDELGTLDRRVLIAELHRHRHDRLVRYIAGAIAADIDRVAKPRSKGAQNENS